MGFFYPSPFEYCYNVSVWLGERNLHKNLTDQCGNFYNFCSDINDYEADTNTEDEYSKPMVLVGMYISLASLFCILAMALDLLSGLRARKFWFPTKYFSLNAASITVITVAIKLPVDLTSGMPGDINQIAKLGGFPFMCTMMSNFMPSLASMDNNSLLANVMALSILVITVIVNVFIQIKTRVISDSNSFDTFFMVVAYIYMGLLFFMLIICVSSAISLQTSKKILEDRYKATSKRAFDDQNSQRNLIEKLTQVVKRYWIMAETGSPQFVIVSNPLSSASGVICAACMITHVVVCYIIIQPLWTSSAFEIYNLQYFKSVYKWTSSAIVISQTIGIIVGSIAPIFRCFTILSFKSFAKENRKHFLVFKIEKYWTKNLCDLKESPISSFSCGPRSRVLLHKLKTLILEFFIGFQKVVVVSCKLIGLVSTVPIIFVAYCLTCIKSLLFTPPTTASIDDHENKDLTNYVLLLKDNMRLSKRTMKGISDSLNRLIKKAERKQHNNLLKLLEKSVAFDGVETFDTDQVQSLLSVEHVNSWSLPVISLTCIAIALPNIQKDRVDSLLKSVDEGLLYTHLVEESLNKESVYVNIRRTTLTLWLDVEGNYKWSETTLKSKAYQGKKPTEIVLEFARVAEEILNEFNTSVGGEVVEKENLPSKIITANSMYRIAHTILHTYASTNLEITEEELFARLSNMITDILAACLTNIPRVITRRCEEGAIEKRQASVLAAVDLLGRTTEIIKQLEKRELPNMDPDKMELIDEWRLHLKQP